MTEKELKKLNRYQLLELLIMQTERADDLQQRLDEVVKIVRSQEFRTSRLGSIAESSIQVSGVFEAAQKAADLYIEAAHEKAAEIVQDARQQAEEIIAHAEKRAKFLAVMDENISDSKQN